jgi:hypothetical protein
VPNQDSKNHAARTISPQDVVQDLIATMDLADRDQTLVERICAQWIKLEDILECAAGPREPVGELLVKSGRITRAQLDEALAEQQRTSEKFGEVLVRKGRLSKPELAALLTFQERLGASGQHAGPLQLGNLLVTAGKITFEQLQDAVRRQQETKRRLGEELVAAGYTTKQQIDQGLKLQRVLIGVALSALLVLSMAPGGARANSSKTAQIRVSATVAPYVKLDVLEQQSALSITREDVERGYVDVMAGTRLRTRTNDRNGFMVNFESRSQVFEHATVTGLGGTVEIGTNGGAVRAAYSGPETSTQVSYRFFLAPGVQSGQYPWPLQISASVVY